MLFCMEGKSDSVIQGETITAVCDLDKNTAGGTTKEGSHTGCQHVVISWQLTRHHAKNITHTVLEVLVFLSALRNKDPA